MSDKAVTNRKYKIGDVVYIRTTWIPVEKAKIVDYYVPPDDPQNKEPVYVVHSIDNHGTAYVTEDCIFRTKDEAIKTYELECEAQTKKYCDEIKTLEDLIRFPLEHCFCGEEYTDYEAIEAYKIRAKEIAGTDFGE